MLRSRKGRVWELEALFAAAQGGLVRVGRAVDNTLSLASHLGDSSAALTLSRRHAALRVDAGQLQLQDSATLNGTFVNDQRLPANAWKVLNEGDTFSLGGPPTSTAAGIQVEDNPWTFTVHRLHDFLAAHVPHGRGPALVPAAAATAPAAAAAAPPPQAADARPVRNLEARFAAAAAEPVRAAPPPPPRRSPARPPRAPPVEEIDLTVDEVVPGAGALAASLRKRRLEALGTFEPRAPPGRAADSGAEQPARRQRRDPAATGRVPTDTSSRGTTAAGPAAAAAAGPAAAPPAAAGPTDGDRSIKEQFTCAICQDLVAPAYALVPCGHLYCGECAVAWLPTKRECPTCRQKCTAPPLRQTAVDGVIASMAARLEADERETWREKTQRWEQGRAGLERQLGEPWAARRPEPPRARGGGGAGGPAGLPPGLAGLPADMIEHMLAALGGAHLFPHFAAAAGGGGGGAPRRAAPLHHLPPPVNEYRCELAPARGALPPCAACAGPMEHHALRIGVRRAAFTRQEQATTPFSWHHLPCLPAGHWAEARTRGVANLGGIPPADQSRVRARLRL